MGVSAKCNEVEKYWLIIIMHVYVVARRLAGCHAQQGATGSRLDCIHTYMYSVTHRL